jgi:hypothetical protein
LADACACALRSWTDSAEEDTILPARGGNTLDIVSD